MLLITLKGSVLLTKTLDSVICTHKLYTIVLSADGLVIIINYIIETLIRIKTVTGRRQTDILCVVYASVTERARNLQFSAVQSK
jgi:hypothetical protein